MLLKGAEAKERELDESHVLHLKEQRNHVFGSYMLDQSALLMSIDLQFMTCVRSTTRIAELFTKEKNKTDKMKRRARGRGIIPGTGQNAHTADDDDNDDNGDATNNEVHPSSPLYKPTKVSMWYENDASIVPLPPFLAHYTSAKTRTAFDMHASLVHHVSSRHSRSTKMMMVEDQSKDATRRRGELAVRDIIRTMDIMSNSQHDAMKELTRCVKSELIKPPEHRSKKSAEKYRAAYHFITSNMKAAAEGDGSTGGSTRSGASSGSSDSSQTSSRKNRSSTSTTMDLNQLMTKFLLELQCRCVVQNRRQAYLDYLKLQHQKIKAFMRSVRDENQETRRYLKQVGLLFALLLLFVVVVVVCVWYFMGKSLFFFFFFFSHFFIPDFFFHFLFFHFHFYFLFFICLASHTDIRRIFTFKITRWLGVQTQRHSPCQGWWWW